MVQTIAEITTPVKRRRDEPLDQVEGLPTPPDSIKSESIRTKFNIETEERKITEIRSHFVRRSKRSHKSTTGNFQKGSVGDSSHDRYDTI